MPQPKRKVLLQNSRPSKSIKGFSIEALVIIDILVLVVVVIVIIIVVVMMDEFCGGFWLRPQDLFSARVLTLRAIRTTKKKEPRIKRKDYDVPVEWK